MAACRIKKVSDCLENKCYDPLRVCYRRQPSQPMEAALRRTGHEHAFGPLSARWNPNDVCERLRVDATHTHSRLWRIGGSAELCQTHSTPRIRSQRLSSYFSYLRSSSEGSIALTGRLQWMLAYPQNPRCLSQYLAHELVSQSGPPLMQMAGHELLQGRVLMGLS